MLKRASTISGPVAAAPLCAGPAAPQSAPPDATAAAKDLVATMRLDDQFNALMRVIL